MSTRQNSELARRAWDAVSQADVETIREIWHEGLVWHATTRGTPWQGEHKGPDAILDFLARIGESMDRFDVTLHDVLVSEQRFALVFHISAERDGRHLEADYHLMARVAAGRVAEVWTGALEPGAVTAFWD